MGKEFHTQMFGLQDHYRFLEPLGSGAEGEVYLVQDLRHEGRLAALKMVEQQGDEAPQEFRKLVRLRHPGIARVLDAGVVDNPPRRFFATEFFSGEPITQLPAPLDLELVVAVLRDTCEALAYLNEQGLRHGDLKPAHILVDPNEPRTQLIDLGYACRIDDPGAPAAGTAPYAAPELWRSPVVGARNSDLYALGMIWLELLAGRLPHQGDTESWRLWHQAGDRDKALDMIAVDVPAELRQLLKDCLSADPSDRPHDAEALLRRLPAKSARRITTPPLIGRDDALETLRRWALESGPEDPDLLLLAGTPGVGKSRLLRALARTVQATGARVEYRALRPQDHPEGLAPVLRRALGGPAQHRLLVLDDAELEVDGVPLHQWWKRLTAELRDPPVRGVLALDSADPRQIDLTLERLRRASIPAQLRHLEPLDWQGTRELIEECVPNHADGDDLQRIWLESSGVPARILRLALGEQTPAETTPDESPLLELLAQAPAPVPIDVLLAALRWKSAALWSELARLEGVGLVVDGVHPDLRVHPHASLSPTKSFSLDITRRLADAWSEHNQTTPNSETWPVQYLQMRLGEIDEESVLAACRSLEAAGQWTQLGRFATLAVEKDVPAVAFMLTSWVHLGRRREVVDWVEKHTKTLEKQPSEDVVSIARVLAQCIEPKRAIELLERAASAVEDPRQRLEWTIEGAQLALAEGQRETARTLLNQLEADGLLDPNSRERTAAASLRLGEITQQLGRRELAGGLFDTALAEARRVGDVATILRSLSGLAGIARGSGNLAEAERLLRLGTHYARRTGQASRAREALHTLETNLGSLYLRMRRTAEAIEIYQRLEREMRRTESTRQLPYVGYGLGMAYRNRGEILRSLQVLLRAERDARSAQNTAALSGILRTIGAAYLYHGDPARAYAVRLAALRLAHRLSNPYLIAISRAALVGALVRQGRVEIADRMAHLVYAAPECTPLMRIFVAAFTAEARRDNETSADAIRRWGTACRDAIRTDDAYYTCRALIGLARLTAKGGDRGRARALLARAERWARRDPAPILSRIPIQLAQLRLDLDDHGLTSDLESRLESLFRSAHTHGLKEEALTCAFLLRDTHHLADDAQRLRGRFRRRLAKAELAALEHRLDLTGVAAWITENAAQEQTQHILGGDLERALRRLTDSSGAASVAIRSSRGEIVARWPEQEPASASEFTSHETTLVPWRHAAPLTVVMRGGHPPTSMQLDDLGASLVPTIAQHRVAVLEGSVSKLQGQLDELRARSLSERERLKTEVLSRRLELDHLGSVQHPISDPARSRQRWVAESPAMREIEQQLERWAESDLPVFIYGESGTGKDLLALRLHDRSPRQSAGFRVENCPAIHEELFEVQLFGYVQGAFTGADEDRDGILAELNGGTLVLDHVAELPDDAQARLLRVLDDGSYRPVGGSELRAVDLRIIATGYRAAAETISAGNLRPDLYYRLQGIEIRIPPLRERPEDIPALLATLLDWHSRRLGVPIPVIEDECMQQLRDHSWPGNVRELENLILRWLLLKTRTISPRELGLGDDPMAVLPTESEATASASLDLPWREAVAAFQKQFLTQRLEALEWNRSRTAEALGLSRRQLHNLLEKLEIRPPE